MKKTLKLFSLLLGGTLVLAGCDNFSPNWPTELPKADEMSIDTPWSDYVVPCTSITLGKGENNISLNKGETYTFTYSTEPRNATLSSLVWESENVNIATVENGVVTAVNGGTTYVTVSSGEVKARSKINVVVPITDFEITNKNLDLDFGDQVQIASVITPADTTQGKLKYELVEPGIITVSESGLVTALQAEGTNQIRVTNEVLNKVETIDVHVSDKWNYVSSFTLDGPANLEVNKEGQIEANVVGIDSSVPATTLRNNSVKYSVVKANEDDPDIVTIDEDTGDIKAVEVGDAIIHAELIDERASEASKLKEATFNVHVFEISATAITLNTHSTIELNNKDEDKASFQLSYEYTLSDPSYSEPSRGHVTYSTSNPNIVKINDDGLVESVGVLEDGTGDAVITVRDTRYNVSDSVNVHNTIYAKSISLSGGGNFYLDESVTITANVNPANTSDHLVWEYDDTTGHTFVENGKQLIITCNNLTEPVVVGAHVGALAVEDENKITLTPKERDVAFENGKAYIVGSSNYKSGVSKDAGAEGSWNVGKYAYVFTDKTGNAHAKYEYKATIEFRENDLWKIRENASDWRQVEGFAGENEDRHQIGRYKVDEGAFAAGQMAVTADEDQNILVKQAGKYDVYYAFYENEHPEGWYEVFVEEHGLKVTSTNVHVKEDATATITASNWEGTLLVNDVDNAVIEVTVNSLTGAITITPVAVGTTSFKVVDDLKEIVVNVEVKAGSTAPATAYYIRGTAVNGWNDVSEDYVLRESADPNNVGEILDVYLSEGEFKIATADWSSEFGWDYDSRSTIIGGAAEKFSAGASDNNIKCNVAGYYNIFLTTNNYISVESVGGDDPINVTSYYVRGTAVGSWDALQANQLTQSSDPNNVGEILDISLSVGEFKIANADWSKSWGYKYKNDDEVEDHITVQGGAAANFEQAPGDDCNIKCKVADVYNIYLTNNNYIYIEFATAPVFALSATEGTIEQGGSFEVTASNVTGTLAYSVTDGTADVIINGNVATISSSTVGEATIAFSDDSEVTPINFTLTVIAPVTMRTQFIETKSWFNNGETEGQKVCVYAFKKGVGGEAEVENAPFPGVEATWIKNLDSGKKLFSFDIASTYDFFIVSDVVGDISSENVVLQTVDIEIASLGTDNCIYFQDDLIDGKVDVAPYNYQIGLSAEDGTISVGGSVDVTIRNFLGTPTYQVSDEHVNVVINDGVATISATETGSYTVTFRDDSEYTVTYSLTVNALSNVVYTVENFPSWWTSDSAHIYAWAFKSGEAGHWYEGVVNGSNMTFTIPSDCNKATFVRVSGAISDLSKWDGTTFSGMEKWNRSSEIDLSGSTSSISVTLGDWFD